MKHASCVFGKYAGSQLGCLLLDVSIQHPADSSPTTIADPRSWMVLMSQDVDRMVTLEEQGFLHVDESFKLLFARGLRGLCGIGRQLILDDDDVVCLPLIRSNFAELGKRNTLYAESASCIF